MALKHIPTGYMDATGLTTSDDRFSVFYTVTTRKPETTERASEKLQNEGGSLSDERRSSTHLNSIDHLMGRIKRGPKDRAKFVASHLDKGISYQIRALRDRQELSQENLASLVGMSQNAISRLESSERGHPTITTLKRLAEAFDVALVVRFLPFSKLVKWVSGTPFIEYGLSTESLAVPNFEEELEQGQLEISATSIVPEMQISIRDMPGVIDYYRSIEPINCCGHLGQVNEAHPQDLTKYFFEYDTDRNQGNLFGEEPAVHRSTSTFDPLLLAGMLAQQQQTPWSERKRDDA